MDLDALQTNITAWVETYAGIPCEWGRMPQNMIIGPYVLAYLGPITKLGHDERIQTYDFDTDATEVTVTGVRRLTLRLSFRTNDQRLGSSARQEAETFRVALHAQSSFDTLNDANLALVDTGELVENDFEWSGRTVSQTDLEVIFNLRAQTPDPNHDGSYIKSVAVSSQQIVVDEDNTPVVDENGDLVVTEDADGFTITSP